MRLPVVTIANLDDSKKLLEELIERKTHICMEHDCPVEINVKFPQFRIVIISEEQYDVLLFGLNLLIKSVEDYSKTPESVRIELPEPSTALKRLVKRLW